MYIKDVMVDWDEIAEDSYLNTIEAISGIEKITFNKDVTFFVGENGTGKSTLLEAIAIASGFNPEGGTKNYSFSTFDSHSELYNAIRLSRTGNANWGYFLRAESFYNVATKEEEYSREGGTALHLHEKSHGESFLTILQNSFSRPGLYILDEPEAALSPQRQLTLLAIIHELREIGAQFIIVTHSPILLGLPDTDILSFDGKLHSISYEDTDSYKITNLFMNNRKQVLDNLFREI